MITANNDLKRELNDLKRCLRRVSKGSNLETSGGPRGYKITVRNMALCRLTSLFHTKTMLCVLNVFQFVTLTETWNQFAITTD